MWKPILGGRYEVSDMGEVRNHKGRVMKPTKNKRGYLSLLLNDGTKYIHRGVHKWVLIAFLGDQPSKEPNHMNGIKTDNRLVNLEWVTGDENQAHAVKFGLKRHSKFIGPRMKNRQFFSRQALYLQYGC